MYPTFNFVFISLDSAWDRLASTTCCNMFDSACFSHLGRTFGLRGNRKTEEENEGEEKQIRVISVLVSFSHDGILSLQLDYGSPN